MLLTVLVINLGEVAVDGGSVNHKTRAEAMQECSLKGSTFDWNQASHEGVWRPCCQSRRALLTFGWAMMDARIYSESMLSCVQVKSQQLPRSFSHPPDRNHQLAIVKEKVATIRPASTGTRGTRVMLFAFAFGDTSPRAPLGRHPWLPLFLRSAGLSGVNYTIIGTKPDYDEAYGLIPPNVRFVETVYSDFIEDISRFLFNVSAPKALVVDELHAKAEDFKPMLGAMYQDKLAGFDWWGHIDVDMMVGNIRSFLPAEMLLQYDVITPLPANPWNPLQVWAPFTMYRNRPDIVHLYKRLNMITLKTLLLGTPKVTGFAGASGGAGGHWGSSDSNGIQHLSMSSLLQNNIADMKLHVFADGLPYASDWKCVDHKTGLVGTKRCNECVFATNEDGTAATVLHAVGFDGYDEALLCNFRFGKVSVARKMHMLKHKGADMVAQANLIFQSFPEGFRAHVKSTALRLEKVPEYKDKNVSWEHFGIHEDIPAVGITEEELWDSSVLPVKRRVKDPDVFLRMFREETALKYAQNHKVQLEKPSKKKAKKKGGLATSKFDYEDADDNGAGDDGEAAEYDDDDSNDDGYDNPDRNPDGNGKSTASGHSMVSPPREWKRAPLPKIRLFTLLFGEEATTNPWLKMFLKSTSDTGINITIVGSPPVKFELPENVDQIEITLLDLVKKTSEMVFDGKPLRELERNILPYKVIDFKPLLGFLFGTDLVDFDWWGHIDNDILLGNVRRFLSPDMLAQYDVVSPLGGIPGQQFRTWGPFTMYRNSAKVNTLFRLAGKANLRALFTNPDAMWFDEWGQGNSSDFDPDRKLANTSMTYILSTNREKSGLRLADPHSTSLPMVWDANCRLTMKYGLHCGQCRLRTAESGRQELAGWKSSKWKEMLLCHFQMGKGNLKTMVDSFEPEDWGSVKTSNELLVGGFTGGIQTQVWDEKADPLPEGRSIKLRTVSTVKFPEGEKHRIEDSLAKLKTS